MALKRQQKLWGLKDREISEATGRPIDTIRKLGRVRMAPQTLDEIEEGMERARQSRLRTLQKAVS